MRPSIVIAFALLAGCARSSGSSGVMEAEGGTYLISARASSGTARANKYAYEEAKKFCAEKGGRPIVIDATERDVYQSSGVATANAYGGSAASGTRGTGNANLRFRCEN